MFNRYLPDVYVTAKDAITFKSLGDRKSTTQRFGLILRLENNMDIPISFFTPEFYVRVNPWYSLRTPKWNPAPLIIPLSTFDATKPEEFPHKVIFIEGYVKSVVHSKKIRLDAHDLVDDYIGFLFFDEPKYYKLPSLFVNSLRNIGSGEWAVGKIVIKPVGSKPISKKIYFRKEVIRDIKDANESQTIEVHWGDKEETKTFESI